MTGEPTDADKALATVQRIYLAGFYQGFMLGTMSGIIASISLAAVYVLARRDRILAKIFQ
jgi:hypothetical protein